MINNELQSLKRIFVDYPKKYKEQKQKLIIAEQERQDLLHVLEFGKLNAVEMSKIMRELKSVLQRRRRIKNNIEVLEVFNKFSISFNNNVHKDKQIDTLANTVKNIVERERTYTMRVRTDLQDLIE